MSRLGRFEHWFPALASVSDFAASILIVSAVLEFSNKQAAMDSETEADYMDHEFLVAKKRTKVAMIFIVASFLLNIVQDLQTLRDGAAARAG